MSRYVIGTQDKSGAKRVRTSARLIIFNNFLLVNGQTEAVFFSEFTGDIYCLMEEIQPQFYLMYPVFLRAQVDLLRGQKSDKVDVTIQPEELEAMEDVLPAKCVELPMFLAHFLKIASWMDADLWNCFADTKKRGKRRSCGTRRKTSATWSRRCVWVNISSNFLGPPWS